MEPRGGTDEGPRGLSVASSPRPSSAGTGAASSEELLRELHALPQPESAGLAEHLAKVNRIARALKSIGHVVSVSEIAKVSLKAELVYEAFAEACSSWEPRTMVRHLRGRFSELVVEGGREDEVEAVGEAILGLGGRPSEKADKSGAG